MTDLQSLLDRCRAATGPDLQLDRDLALAFGLWSPPLGYVQDPECPRRWYRKDFVVWQPDIPISHSVDAVLALIERKLPNHDWSVGHLPVNDDADHDEHHEFGALLYANSRVTSPQDSMEHGATPALALLSAALSALIAQQGT